MLDDCFTYHFPLLQNFSILGNAERTGRGYRDLSSLKFPQNSIDSGNELIAELNKCSQCVESSSDASWADKKFQCAFSEVFVELEPL